MTNSYCWICQSPATVHVQGTSYVCQDHADGTGGKNTPCNPLTHQTEVQPRFDHNTTNQLP